MERSFELYTEDVQIVRKEDYCIDFANKYGDFFVHAKWDGCCDIYHYHNGATFKTKNPSEHDVNYIHICGLREFISLLTAIADIAENTSGFEGYESTE